MRILLFGANGQLGWELRRSLIGLGDVIAPTRQDTALCGDLNNLEGLAHTVRALAPDVVVNAAAYTAVDRAQSEPELAHRVNALAPGTLAQACADVGAWLLHYSTDYVFDGSGSTPWREADATAPLNVYGQTKLAGERLVQTGCERHLILRTSWVYGRHGQNFAKTMLRLAMERESLNVVSDQIGVPTNARWLADLSAQVLARTSADDADSLAPRMAGLYHLCPAGATSWHGYAQYLLNQARTLGYALKTGADAVQPIVSAQYPTPARRPHNSRLDCSKFDATFGLDRPDWRCGIDRFFTDTQCNIGAQVDVIDEA